MRGEERRGERGRRGGWGRGDSLASRFTHCEKRALAFIDKVKARAISDSGMLRKCEREFVYP